MSTSLAVPSRTATKEARFAVHITDTQRVFLCSETKSAPLTKTLRADLHKYEFYQPSPAFCRALVIDIDHIFAPNYIFDLPREIYPHAVIFTAQGVQAFWLIEGVPLTSKAHQAPIRFARDTAELLRRACSGDPAVNALSPSKCRNPLYKGAEVIYPTDCPPYALKALSGALRAFLRASKSPEGTETRPCRPEPVWGELEAGQRNETIFQTIRRTAYRGGDFEAQAYELSAQCNPPLPLSEVAGIVRSVQKFMETRFSPAEARHEPGAPVPDAVREFMAEIGRKGGSRKTEAQTQALARGRVAGNAVKSAQAIGRRAQIQALKEAGYKQREVAEKMGVTVRTVQRSWN
ncbi:primase C-terminal domain-containing protein [Rothia sp. CCM 9417]|uniref:primase C-terminal domain-containing protein n=1 Tax=Rothia sp. CCM 9417 TaxID=3402657 RepID=UPI003ADF8878